MCFPNLRGDLPNDPTNQPIRVVPLMPNGNKGTKPPPFGGDPFGMTPGVHLVREANPNRTLSAMRTDTVGPAHSEGTARRSSSVPKSAWAKGPMSEREYKEAMAREQGRKDGEKAGLESERGLDSGVQVEVMEEGPVVNNRTGMRWLGY